MESKWQAVVLDGLARLMDVSRSGCVVLIQDLLLSQIDQPQSTGAFDGEDGDLVLQKCFSEFLTAYQERGAGGPAQAVELANALAHKIPSIFAAQYRRRVNVHKQQVAELRQQVESQSAECQLLRSALAAVSKAISISIR